MGTSVSRHLLDVFHPLKNTSTSITFIQMVAYDGIFTVKNKDQRGILGMSNNTNHMFLCAKFTLWNSCLCSSYRFALWPHPMTCSLVAWALWPWDDWFDVEKSKHYQPSVDPPSHKALALEGTWVERHINEAWFFLYVVEFQWLLC